MEGKGIRSEEEIREELNKVRECVYIDIEEGNTKDTFMGVGAVMALGYVLGDKEMELKDITDFNNRLLERVRTKGSEGINRAFGEFLEAHGLRDKFVHIDMTEIKEKGKKGEVVK